MLGMIQHLREHFYLRALLPINFLFTQIFSDDLNRYRSNGTNYSTAQPDQRYEYLLSHDYGS